MNKRQRKKRFKRKFHKELTQRLQPYVGLYADGPTMERVIETINTYMAEIRRKGSWKDIVILGDDL